MRHRDDDLSQFRSDPVVQALSAPGTEAELADEAAAVAAYRTAVPPKPQGRSAARVATTGVAAVVVLAVSGGAAAAYTSNLPDSWQTKLYNDLPSLHFPKPKATPRPAAQPPPSPVLTQSSAPVMPSRSPSPTSTRHATATATPSGVPSSPAASPTLPVDVGSATTPATPSPTTSHTAPPPATGAQLSIAVSPGTRVTVGSNVTVTGKLTDGAGSAVANRHVVLAERQVGQGGWHRLATVKTATDGHVSYTVSALQRNALLELRAGRDHSAVVRVVVVPIISLTVASTSPGDTSTSVTISVKGAQPGDVVGVQEVGGETKRGTLNSSLTATFTVPVSRSQVIHYRAFVPRTGAHAAHSLAFYTPASG